MVTGKGRRSLNTSLNHLNMSNIFDVIITDDDVKSPKPDPEGINIVLKKLNLDKSEAIFLGDSDADILAGKNADVFTVGVHWLTNYQTSEFSIKPDKYFKSISEFEHFFFTL